MTAPLFIATSLAPGRDVAAQRAAVTSWRAAGFKMLSVNAAAELPQLTRDHPDVTFVTAAKTGERVARKPVPYIHDLLKALRADAATSGAGLTDCIVGIVNDDIHFRLSPAQMAEIAAAAQGSLVLGARVDVADATALGGFRAAGDETYSTGYDFFLMSGDLLDDFGDTPFCVGMPFWDYWMPLVALLKGRPLKALRSPVALHIAHETRWDDTIYVYFHALMTAVLEACEASRGQDTSAYGRQFDLMLDALGHLYKDAFARGTKTGADGNVLPDAVEGLAAFYDRFQEVAVHHIKSRAVNFTLSA